LKNILEYFQTDFYCFRQYNKNQSIFVSVVCYTLTVFNLNKLVERLKNLIKLVTSTQLHAIWNYGNFILYRFIFIAIPTRPTCSSWRGNFVDYFLNIAYRSCCTASKQRHHNR